MADKVQYQSVFRRLHRVHAVSFGRGSTDRFFRDLCLSKSGHFIVDGAGHFQQGTQVAAAAFAKA